MTFSSLSSSSSSSSADGLANLKVGLFLLEKFSLDLIDGLSSPLMGKLGKLRFGVVGAGVSVLISSDVVGLDVVVVQFLLWKLPEL